MNPAAILLYAAHCAAEAGKCRSAPSRLAGSPQKFARANFRGPPRPGVTLALAAPGPPVQLRWTTLRVQGPTRRDAALANDGDGSPPVARGASPPPLHEVPRPLDCATA